MASTSSNMNSLSTLSSSKVLFSQDSPLFAKSIDDQTKDIAKLADYLKSLTQLMKKFCKDTRTTAKEANTIASHMHTGLSSSSSQQIIPMMNVCGDIFAEIASSQELLSDTLLQNFITPLEKFYNDTISSMFLLKQQYNKERERHDDKIIKYLQCDSTSAFIRQSQANQVEYRAMDVVNHRKSYEMIRYDLVRQINDIHAKTSFELSETCISSMMSLKSSSRSCADHIDMITNNIINDHHDDHNIYHQQRQEYDADKINYDRQRDHISSILDIMIERVDNQIPQTSSDININRDSFISPSSSSNDINSMSTSSSASYDDNNVSSSSSNNNMMGTISKFGAMGVAMGANWIGGFKRASSEYDNNKLNNKYNKKSSSSSSEMMIDANNVSSPSSSSSSSSYSVEDTEARMKVLDKTELEAFYIKNAYDHDKNILKQGYVLERGTSKLLQTVWYRRWLILDDHKLYIIKEGYDIHEPLGMMMICEVLLASVREVKHPELPYVFEVSYANMKSYMFQAEGMKEYHAWIDMIRAAIERRLIANISSSSSVSSYKNTTSSSSTSSSAASAAMNVKIHDVKHIMHDNHRCCECEKIDPDWMSLNLGSIICIDCSGVHRSLGVHVSKVRSLTLDDLEPEEYDLMKKLGNKVNHDIWEASYMLTSDDDPITSSSSSMISSSVAVIKKPSSKDDHATRDRFIRAKYITKEYIIDKERLLPTKPSSSSSSSDTSSSSDDNIIYDEAKQSLSKDLINACMKDDAILVLKLLALGAPVNGDDSIHITPSIIIDEIKPHHTDDDAKDDVDSIIPLHVACQYGSIASLVLLVLHGADLSIAPNTGKKHIIDDDATIIPSSSMTLSSPMISSSSSAIDDMLPCIKIAKKYQRINIINYLMRKAELLGIINQHHMMMMNVMDSPASSNSDDSGFDSILAHPSASTASMLSSSFMSNIDTSSSSMPSSSARVSGDISDIGEKLHQASSSSTSSSLLEKFVSSSSDMLSSTSVDMIKKVLASVGEVSDEIIHNISASISIDEEPEPLYHRRPSSASATSKSPRASLAHDHYHDDDKEKDDHAVSPSSKAVDDVVDEASKIILPSDMDA